MVVNQRGLAYFEDVLKNFGASAKISFDSLVELCSVIDRTLPSVRRSERNVNFSLTDTDFGALQLLPAREFQEFIPLKTTGDGSCLFRAASTLISGVEDCQVELRVRCIVELALNKHYYLCDEELIDRIRAQENLLMNNRNGQHEADVPNPNMEAISLAFDEEVKNMCVNPQSWSSVWALQALAAVLQCRIRSVYPETGDDLRKWFHLVILPRVQGNNETLAILWSREGVLNQREQFVPNHFVPLISRGHFTTHDEPELPSMLACPHPDCKTKSTFYKNLQQHYHSCHKDNVSCEAAEKQTHAVKSRIVKEKVMLSSCNVIGGELFHVSFGGDTMQLRGTDEYSIALSAACVLLAGNKLRSYSVSPRQEITVGSPQKTILYHAWAKFENSKYEPEIECVQTIVNSDSLCEDSQFIFQSTNGNIDTLSEEVNYCNLDEITLDIPTNITVQSAKDLLPFLHKFYGYNSFKSKQEEVIDLILQKLNIFVNMPTGGGKTVTYVLPTIVRSGITVVITPLLSLINDQIKSLSQKGIPSAQYTGSTSSAGKQSVLFALKQPICPVKLLYVTPEMLTKDVTLTTALQSLYSRDELQMFVYDEAHCISAWGHDFRTSYMDCSLVKRLFPRCPALILSASATVAVQEDVCKILGIVDIKQVTDTFNRPNLFYEVKSKTRDTIEEISEFVKDFDCSLIFCATRGETETVNAQLRAKGIRCASFHAGLSSELKGKHTEDWMNGSLQSLCCTSAFGMGIDKANVRAVVHYSIPHSIEDYFQESGRGGRDGLPCRCILFFSPGDQINILRGIYRSTEDDPSFCTKKLLNFQHVMHYGLNLNLCRRKILVGFFSREDVNCNLGCDICKEDKSSGQCFDTTSITKSIIECIQSIRTSSAGFFKLQHFVEVITGKKTKNVLKNNHHQVAQYGMLNKCNKKKAEHFLRHLVCLDILRELPVDNQSQHSGFYLGLGSRFIDILSGQMHTFHHEKL